MFTAAVVWFKPACNCRNGIAIFSLEYLRCVFICVPWILQETTRFFAFSKNVFVSQFKKNVCFVFCGLTGTRAKQFALGYPLHCALFAFRKFCKKQHAFSHFKKLFFVSQFKKTFVLCFAVWQVHVQNSLRYVTLCVALCLRSVNFARNNTLFHIFKKLFFVSQFKKNVCFVFCCLTGTRTNSLR